MGWIGQQKTYTISGEIEKQFGSLLYYGGRERSIMNKVSYSKWDNGNGAIHGFGGVYKQCEYYRSGDWITFEIDMEDRDRPNCKIYKNGKLVAEMDALPFKSERKKKRNDRKLMLKSMSILSRFFGDGETESGMNEYNKMCMKEEEETDTEAMYFCGVLDDSMDGFIVEEVLYNPTLAWNMMLNKTIVYK